MLAHGNVSIRSYTIFPQRIVQTAADLSPLETDLRANWPETVTYLTYPYDGGKATERWDHPFTRTDTRVHRDSE
jgi:hypothetical protein